MAALLGFRHAPARQATRLVLVLDEFPYLVDAELALPSILQSIWDHQLQQARVKLILSGSHITAMKRPTEADQPLYGRRTGLIQTDPLDYLHVAAFVPAYSPKEKVIAYGVFGGWPGHLTLLDPNASLVENAARQFLDPTVRLHEEAVHAFDPFLGDAEVHCSIIHGIANGDVQWQKISNRVGKKSASLSRSLDWFKEMEVIEQYAPITAYPNPNPKSMSYRLRDPYLHPDSTTTSVSTSAKTSAGSSSRPPDASVFPSAPSGPGNGGRPMASTRSTSSRSAPTAGSC